MHKRKPMKKISIVLPVRWIALIDDRARAECTTRTQIIKNIIIARCLRPDKER